VFGIDTHIDTIQHHGATDPLVLIRVLMEVHSIPKDECLKKLREMQKVMCSYFEADKQRYGKCLICTGVSTSSAGLPARALSGSSG
jgi:hypothetical protein